MKRQLPLLLGLLIAHGAVARDTGYALECTAVETGARQLLSFLEDDVDKTARYLETGDLAFWDSHTWTPDTLVVASVRQQRGADPVVQFSITVTRASLQAVLVDAMNPTQRVAMQCARWSPRTRNK